ncbi:ATP-binding protein [Deinococcus navajonensis]|uniref:ATP-binding protein n=1 Tax=Deinococcus navajonensis TaxID=309884 RepID=A0ABV8XJC7_9DEIO
MAPPLTLRLLGAAMFSVSGEAGQVLERRAAALLALLALDGPRDRAALAALLYDNVQTGRNNLVHLLRRVNRVPGGPLVVGSGELALAPDVDTDVRRALDGEAPWPAAPVTFLADFDFSDLPALEDWVVAWRERLADAQRAEAARQVTQAEEAGDLGEAARLCEHRLTLDPLDEAAWRRLIHLHARQGHRAAALGAYARCAEVLRRELGAPPAPETQALARAVRRGAPDGEGALLGPAAAAVPLSVLRPPELIGRDREWARMHTALAAGRSVEVSGEQGLGKTRLLQDLVRATPGAWCFEVRPDDARTPYGAHTRLLRALLARSEAALPGWVRRELARLLPELGDPLPPVQGAEEQARFYQAQAWVLRSAAAQGLTLLALDNVQHLDPLSAEAWPAVWTALGWGSPHAALRVAWATRPPEPGLALGGAARARAIELIHLEPLSPEAAGALLASLGVPALLPHAEALQRFTGGHPHLLLETVRHLLETGGLGRPAVPLQAPRALADMLAQRLERLSPTALQAARAAAVLGGDVRPDLAAEVLGLPLMDMAGAWEDLERAQILQGERFAHDLVREAVTGDMPGTVRGLLHRSAARVLARHGAPAAEVAHHWAQGGDARQAAGLYLDAAAAARAAWQFRSAAVWSERAAALLEEAGDPTAAFEAWVTVADTLREQTLDQRARDVTAHLTRLAVTPHQQARVQAARLQALVEDSDVEGLEAAALEGLARLEAAPDPRLAATFQEALAGARLLRGDTDAALDPLEALRELGEALADPAVKATAHEGLGLAWAARDPGRAAGHYDRAAALHGATGDRVGAASVLTKRAPLLFALGDARGAAQAAGQAHDLLRGVDGADHLKLINAHERFCAAFALEAYGEAGDALQEGLRLGSAAQAGWGGVLQADLAVWQATRGDLDEAAGTLEVALAHENVPENKRHVLLMARVRVHAARGDDVTGPLLALGRHVQRLNAPLVTACARVLDAACRPPADAAPAASLALELAGRHGFRGLRRAALVHRARAQLTLGKWEAAQADVQAALALTDAFSLFVSATEVLGLFADLLEQAQDPGAPAARAAFLERRRALDLGRQG